MLLLLAVAIVVYIDVHVAVVVNVIGVALIVVAEAPECYSWVDDGGDDKGSFVLHLLVGFWWDQVWNRWDGSQLLPSQTPTNHPSWIFWLILTSVPKRKFNKHKIATISSHQNPTKSFYVLSFSFPFHLWKVGFGWDEWLVTCVEKWKLTKTNDDWTL